MTELFKGGVEPPADFDQDQSKVRIGARGARLATKVQDGRGNQVRQVGEVHFAFGPDGALEVYDGRGSSVEAVDQIELMKPGSVRSRLREGAANNAQRRGRERNTDSKAGK